MPNSTFLELWEAHHCKMGNGIRENVDVALNNIKSPKDSYSLFNYLLSLWIKQRRMSQFGANSL